MQTQISSVPSNAVLSQCFLTCYVWNPSAADHYRSMAFLQYLCFVEEVTVLYAHWSCNLWSKKCSLHITIQLHKLGKCSLMLMCHEIGWCNEVTALCGYSAVHMCIILYCSLSIWAKESPSHPKPQTAWSKGGATMPRGAAEDMTLWDMKVHYGKQWTADCIDPDSCFLLFSQV